MLRFSPFALVLRIIKPVATLFVKRLYSRVVIRNDFLEIRGGVIFRRRIYVAYKSVKCISIEQGPILRFFKRFSLYATFKGEGDGVDTSALLLPFATLTEVKAKATECFGRFLSQKDVMCLKGRRFIINRTVYCRIKDVGSARLSRWLGGRKHSLKIVLHSNHNNTVKVCGLSAEKGNAFFKLFCE